MTRDEFDAWRQANSLSITKLASLLGLHRRTMQRICKRATVPERTVLALRSIELSLSPAPSRMPLRDRCTPEKKQFAKNMRQAPTDAEAAMWDQLRGSALGVRARRQSVIRGYIADFYIPSWGLVIEVDGSAHDGAAASARDKKRDSDLSRLGFNVLRVTNDDVLNRPKSVMRRIRAFER